MVLEVDAVPVFWKQVVQEMTDLRKEAQNILDECDKRLKMDDDAEAFCAEAGIRRGLEIAAGVIEETVYALPNPLKKKFTFDDMISLRKLCVQMWSEEIRALLENKE